MEEMDTQASEGAAAVLLSCRGLEKSWPGNGSGRVDAVRDFSFDVREGEICAIVGPSGCGKSTTLKILAGLERPTGGQALYRGRPIDGVDRERVLIFQEPALFPWRTAVENVEFPLQMAGMGAKQRRETALEMMANVGLASFAKSYPRELSKGMQQRLAIAAALVMNPKVLLMDEPFAALDVQTRLLMQKFLVETWEKTRKTIVLITHQIEESLLLADQILMMTARPGTKKWETRLKSPRPGSEEFFSPEFKQLREEMLRKFYEEVRLR